MADQMRTESESPRKYTRRRFLSATAAGLAVGIAGSVAGGLITERKTSETPATAAPPSPSPDKTVQPTQTAQPTPDKTATPSPTPELKVGELPDVLSSTDKDWEKLFAKETDLAKINNMIRQQQAEENAKAQAENRSAKIISLFVFDPVETAKKGAWTVRKILTQRGGLAYALLLPTETQLKSPYEGPIVAGGFSDGGKTLNIKGINGFEFWAEYFGGVEFSYGRVIGGNNYLKITADTKTFRNSGRIDMKGDTTIFASVQKDASNPILSIKWLTNEKGQILYS